jgi:hypothetical protein
MATIIFQRSGGVLGQEIDLFVVFESLPAAEAQLLFKLIDESGFFRISAHTGGRPSADEFQYVISLEVGSTQHTVRTNDSTMPESVRALVNELALLSCIGEPEPNQ